MRFRDAKPPLSTDLREVYRIHDVDPKELARYEALQTSPEPKEPSDFFWWLKFSFEVVTLLAGALVGLYGLIHNEPALYVAGLGLAWAPHINRRWERYEPPPEDDTTQLASC